MLLRGETVRSFSWAIKRFGIYYKKTFYVCCMLQVRTIIRNSFKEALDQYDILISLAAPSVTYKIADLSVTVLMLLQFYWISRAPFLSCRFECFEPRRVSLSRVYALWNATTLSNIVMA